jgi:hypothetical protein
MVHALREAHRVLKPDGILVDLRPAATHRRVGVTCDGNYQEIGSLREKFSDDWAANRAVADILQAGLFRVEWRRRFDCRRVMNTMDEFRAWIENTVRLNELQSHECLIEAVERALGPACGKVEIEARGPLVMRVLSRKEP